MKNQAIAQLMEVEEIELPERHVDRLLHATRRARKVNSSGTRYFDNNKARCARLARFKVNGVPLCFQHAGEAALRFVIAQQEKNNA
jgi:hypothetical protein